MAKNPPLYDIWWSMLRRCEKPEHKDFAYYGARGVRVCEEWHDFEVFRDWILKNLGPRPKGWSLDRYPDRNGDYKPGNVRWANAAMQRANRDDATGDDESDRLIKAFLAMPVPYPSALHFTRRGAWS